MKTLLATLLLSTLAMAGTVNYQTGTFISGTFSGSLTNQFTVGILGSLNLITIQTGILTPDPTACPDPCYLFIGGFVEVGPGGDIFKRALDYGHATIFNGDVFLSAKLHEMDEGLVNGFAYKNGQVSLGYVQFQSLPEPEAWLLLGMGMALLLAMRPWRELDMRGFHD